MEKNIQAYKKAFGTMDKIQQVVLLYETAIASLYQAKEYIAEKNIQECYNKVEKAYLIVSGLRDCIDMQAGGEVAETLVEWYSGTALRIISINRTQDEALCDLCIDNLKSMKDAWIEAEQIAKEADSSEPQQQEKAEINNTANDQPNEGGDYVVSGNSDSEDSSTSIKVASNNGGGASIYSSSLLQGLSMSI